MENEMLKKLAEPFEANEIEWRIQSSGKNNNSFWAVVVPYVQNRAIMERLDTVCGIGKWQNALKEIKDGFLCGISIKIESEWVTKWDGADNTNIESTKGGISSAMKRSAVQWGIGRYLYGIDIEHAETSTTKIKDWNYANTKEGKFWWKTPTLPSWALPKKKEKSPEDETIEQLMATIKWNKEQLIVYVAKKWSKLYNNLTLVEKQSLIELLKKEVKQ